MINLRLFLEESFGNKIPPQLRLLAPILLGTALISIVVSTVWFGGKRESLAAYAEASLLRAALKFAVEPADPSSQVVVISVKSTDLYTLERSPYQTLRDVHIEEYASIVESVAAHNPRMIVISWLGNAHPLTSEYLRPLTDVIDRLGIADRTILAIHLFAAGTVPEDISRKYQVAEARDCYYEVNSFCTWNPSWTWMPQRLADAFWKKKRPWTVSTNLPHTLPNFALNLPALDSIGTFSFLDFRPPVTVELNQGSIVFIGNDAPQDLQFRNNKDLLQRTFVASSKQTRSLMTDGVPFHVFWAGMAQMFLEDRAVAIVPFWICQICLLLMCCGIIAAIHYLGGWALAPFLVSSLSLPVLNALSLKYFKVYMPVIPMIAAGFVIFIAATFISIAASSYRRWRLIAAKANAEQTADIKENFISLISHNLNTPIAQLKGLLDLLIQRQTDAKTLEEARLSLDYMRVTVQAVLNATSMTKNPPSILPGTVLQFWKDFIENEQSLFRKFKIKLAVTPDQEDELDGEIWFYRYSFDMQACRSALLSAIVLAHVKYSVTEMNVHLSPLNPEPGDPRGLIIRMDWKPTDVKLDFEFSPDFIVNAISRYLQVCADLRGISTQFETNGLVLVLPDHYKKTEPV